MKVSLIITTYNWESALESVLESIALQTRIPDEVIVADDGSGLATRNLIQRIAKNFPTTLKHSWQEDLGFRLSRSRNLAIAMSSGDYIIIIDGDMVPNRHFVADHIRAVKPNFYVQGQRIVTLPSFNTAKFLEKKWQPHFFSKGIYRRRHTLRIVWLSNGILKKREGQRIFGVMSCNQGWWKKDLLALNGYDERFIGWGREDDDLVARAYRSGIQRRELRYAALAIHLYHEERRIDENNPNDCWFADNNDRNITACELGINQH